jgi:transcription elongation factor GreB
VVNASGRDTDQVFFGATVKVRSKHGERKVAIVGIDEVDPAHGRVSWMSPVAKALLRAREGDTVVVRAPGGDERLEILEVSYP